MKIVTWLFLSSINLKINNLLYILLVYRKSRFVISTTKPLLLDGRYTYYQAFPSFVSKGKPFILRSRRGRRKMSYNRCYIPLPRKFRKFSELQGAKRPKERSRVLIFSIKCIVQARRAIFFSEKYEEKTTLDENRMQREFPMRSVGNFLCE